MQQAVSANEMAADPDRQLSETIEREQSRLRNFIRSRVPDRRDSEDILQDVFYELVEAYHLMKPIEQVGAWLFRVARHRIIDLLRKKKPEALEDLQPTSADGEALTLEDLLPSPDAGPEAVYARTFLLEELDRALDELPEEQRAIFLAHEIEGRSFRDLASETGLSINTLLSRKHYAVVQLRRRLRFIYEQMNEE